LDFIAQSAQVDDGLRGAQYRDGAVYVCDVSWRRLVWVPVPSLRAKWSTT
jgi:hypothetical protein